MSGLDNLAHILVVEDQEDSRLALEMYLEMHGYRVTSVESAEEGLRAVHAEPPDLVITDFSLPSKTGVEMLEELIAQSALPPSGAIIVTGHPDVKGPPGVVVMQKPVDLDKVLATVSAKLVDAVPRRPQAASPADASAPSGTDILQLALYVSPKSLASQRAQRNLSRLLQAYRADAYSLQVLDVTEQHEQASRDRVDFTPTLVKRSPEPRAWLLGDLADSRALHDLFSAHGLEPDHG